MATHTTESLLQIIYNLNWKGRRIQDAVDWVKYESNGSEIVVFPTALDYTANEFAPVLQLKWEIHNNQVVNLTGTLPEHLSVLSILKEYNGIQ